MAAKWGIPKQTGFFTPEKSTCAEKSRGLPPTLRGFALFSINGVFRFFPLARTCAEVCEGDAAKVSQNGNPTPIARAEISSGPMRFSFLVLALCWFKNAELYIAGHIRTPQH